MKKISLIQTIIFLALGHLTYANNTCPEWFTMPHDNGFVVVLPIYDISITEPDLDCDGIIDVLDTDIDGDGVDNNHDAFPLNSSESIDTDNDGIGNNADMDDDNDGYYDTIEIAAGSSPLNANDTPTNHPVNIHFGDWIRTNPGAGGAINMIGATASGMFVTASDLSGVYVSEDNASIWKARGETNGILNTTHMSALGFHPSNGNIFYVGTGRGIYMTTDKGQTFDFISASITLNNSLYNNDLNNPEHTNDDTNTYIESIVVSKTSPHTMYVTYHQWDENFPSCIAKSTDNGQTWTDITFPVNLRPDNLRIVKLLVHPTNQNLVYAIAGKPRWGCSAAKAYRTINGGQTWIEIHHQYDVLDLDIDYSNDNILYMSTFNVTSCDDGAEVLYHDHNDSEPLLKHLNGLAVNGHLYKSTNKGDSFGDPILSNQTGIISVGNGYVNNASNVKLVNLLTFENAYWMDDNQTGTWESNDFGGTWNHVGTVNNWTNIGYSSSPYNAYTPSYNGYNKTLVKDIFNSNRFYFAGGWPLATFDGGKNFESIATKQIDENKDTWKSTGIENINGYVLDVNDNDEKIIYMGGYDIGFWVSKDRGVSWKWQYPFKNDLATLEKYTWGATNHEPDDDEPSSLKIIGGTNVMTLLSDPQKANIVWSSFARAQSFADPDKGSDPRSGLFRSTNYGDTWTLATIYIKDGTPLDIHYHAVIYGLSLDKSTPVGNRTLYVTIDGDVAKSTDDGRTWHVIHEDGGLKFTDVSGGVLYAGGKNGLWRYKNNVWTQMGAQYKNEMMGIGSSMFRDITPQSNKIHYDAQWHEIIDKYAWNGVHDIQIDPKNSDIVYAVVYRGEGEKDENGTSITPNDEKGLYKTLDGGSTWTRVSLGNYENKYLRAMTISPHNSNILFLTSSENINSGGAGGTSNGIIYSTDAGTSWQELNNGMAWKYAAMIEVDKLNERVWAWSPGTGVQYADIIKNK